MPIAAGAFAAGRRCLHSGPAARLAAAASSASSSGAVPAAFTPARCALLFPGQGSQRCGSVVRSLESEWPSIVRPVWQELDESLQMRLSRAMKDGLQSELNSTELAQPAILAHSYALYRVLAHTLGVKDASGIAKVALGHSLGEYTALAVTGSLPFASAARLVHARGLAMKHATRPGEGGMVALLADSGAPLHLPSILQLLQEAERATEQPVDIANLNSPYQIVISGGTKALGHIKTRVREGNRSSSASSAASSPPSLTRGILRAVSLDVSGPFHSRQMSPAAPALQSHLASCSFVAPSIPVVFNVHANPSVRAERFGEYLLKQLTQPVRWHESLQHAMQRLGVSEFIELGPSTPLSSMLRSTAARLAKQPLLDPLTHPVDAQRTQTQPHASILPLMMPRPSIVVDDGAHTSTKDVTAILGGAQAAWDQIRVAAATTDEDLRTLIKQQTQATPTEM